MFDRKWHPINASTDALIVPGGIVLRIAGTAAVAMTFVPMEPSMVRSFLGLEEPPPPPPPRPSPS